MGKTKISLNVYKALLPVLALVPTATMARVGINVDQVNGDENTLANILDSAKNLIAGVAGTLAILMLIYGGIMYMLSAGDASKATKAKNIILYALIGIAVIVGAYFLVTLISNVVGRAN